MKKLLQSVLGLLMILALAMAVLWSVQNAPKPSQKSLAQATAAPNQQPGVTVTSIPKVTPPEATIAPSVEPVIEPTTRPNTSIDLQHHPKPTATVTSDLNFDTATIVSVETITTPFALSVDWSPDGQKMLSARKVTYRHLLARTEESFTALFHTDLWVCNRQTGQEMKAIDRAVSWDWSLGSDAVVYLAATGDAGFEGELRIFDLSTQSTQTIAKTDVVQSYPGPFWLSNGEIVYMDEARLWVMQPDGSNRRLLNDLQIYNEDAANAGKTEYDYAPDKAAGRLYFSPDEKRIAYTTFPVEPYGESQLWLIDLDGGNRVAMEVNTSGGRDWGSDGTFFLYGKALDDGYFYDLWMADADGSNSRRLIDAKEWGRSEELYDPQREGRPGDIGAVILSPNNRFIVFTHLSKGGLWLLDVASGRWRVLSQDEMFQDIYQIRWPTDDEIVVSAGNIPNIKQFRLTLGE